MPQQYNMFFIETLMIGSLNFKLLIISALLLRLRWSLVNLNVIFLRSSDPNASKSASDHPSQGADQAVSVSPAGSSLPSEIAD